MRFTIHFRIRGAWWPVIAVVLTGLICCVAHAGDLNKGYTFQAGEKNVTHTKLNNLVDQASINTSFYTDKSAKTNADASDVFLVYSPTLSGFRKVTFDNLLLSYTGLITSQNEDESPATNDFALVYDTSAGTYKKVALLNLALPAIWNLPDQTELDFDNTYVPLLNNSTNSRMTMTRFIGAFTNLPAHTDPTNTDQIIVLTGAANETPKNVSIGDLLTNYPSIDQPDADVRVTVADTNGALKQVTWRSLMTNEVTVLVFTNDIPGSPTLASIGNLPVGSHPTSEHHVLMCVTNDLAYIVGAEIPITCLTNVPTPVTFSTFGSGNAFLSVGRPGTNNWGLLAWSQDTNGVINKARWKIKSYYTIHDTR